MARAHEVAIGADGREFSRAIKSDIIKPTEDAARSLDELGTDGSRDLGKLEDAIRQAERSTDRLDRTMEQTARTSDRTWDGASENVRGFKDEAVSNFSEVASSFNGDITQMADGVQGLTGGLAGSLTPGIGIPVAIVGALAGAFLQSWITSTEDSEQRVEDMFGRMSDAGQKFLSEDAIQKAIEDLDTEQVTKGMERARDLALDQGAVLRAMVGDTQAIAAIQEELTRRKQDELDAVKDSGASLEDQKTKADAINTAYGEQYEWLQAIKNDTDTAGKKWDAVREAIEWAGGDVSDLAGRLQGLATGTYSPTIKPVLDDSAMRAAEAWARRGLTVAVTGTLAGRVWE